MVIFRLISLVLVVAALLVLGYDAFTWLKGGESFVITSLGALIDMFAGAGTTEGFSGTWPSWGKMVLGWPAWAVLGVIGLVIAVIFRRR